MNVADVLQVAGAIAAIALWVGRRIPFRVRWVRPDGTVGSRRITLASRERAVAEKGALADLALRVREATPEERRVAGARWVQTSPPAETRAPFTVVAP